MNTADNPHDSVVRQTLGRTEVARGYFRHNLPGKLLEHLDLTTLKRVQDSFVDPELHPSAGAIKSAVFSIIGCIIVYPSVIVISS